MEEKIPEIRINGDKLWGYNSDGCPPPPHLGIKRPDRSRNIKRQAYGEIL